MPEPNSTAAGIAVGAGIGVGAGTILGAQVDALLIGLVGAIFVSIWLPSVNDRLKAVAAVALSSLLAGYGSPVIAAWLSAEQQSLANGSPLRLLLALVIGAASPTVAPVLIIRLKTLAGGKPE